MRRGSSLLVAMVVLAPAGCRSLFHIPSQPADVEVTDPGWFPDVADVADPGSDHRDSGGHDADLPADPGQDSFHDPGCVTQCYGHPCGDEVLRTVGQILSDSCRKEEVVCRYGGEEFGIVVPNSAAADAAGLARGVSTGRSRRTSSSAVACARP